MGRCWTSRSQGHPVNSTFRVQSLNLHRFHIHRHECEWPSHGVQTFLSGDYWLLPNSFLGLQPQGTLSPWWPEPGCPKHNSFSTILVSLHRAHSGILTGWLATSFISPQSPASACSWPALINGLHTGDFGFLGKIHLCGPSDLGCFSLNHFLHQLWVH